MIQSQNTTAGSANDLISDKAFRRNTTIFTIDFINTFPPKGSEIHAKEILIY